MYWRIPEKLKNGVSKIPIRGKSMLNERRCQKVRVASGTVPARNRVHGVRHGLKSSVNLFYPVLLFAFRSLDTHSLPSLYFTLCMNTSKASEPLYSLGANMLFSPSL